MRACVRVGLVVGVLAYAGMLRFDAISQQYDNVDTPRWLGALQRFRQGPSLLRPAAMQWAPWPRFPHRDGPPTQYRSDPYTYLARAREMRGFYDPHLREPLFPFATKIALRGLNDQDVAVSVASGSFSMLAVWGTFALGAIAFSYSVGLGAALLLAIEYDVITIGTQGWRDDAFTAAVVWCCVAAIGFARCPTRARAIALGSLWAATCLVRVTAMSFLVPVWMWIAVTPTADTRGRLRHLAIATIVGATLVAPYLLNCWRAFGDPFYAIDVHAAVYQTTEDPSRSEPSSAGRFLISHLVDRPFATVDTAALGMTAYPFINKWVGFSRWSRGMGNVLAVASLLGLALFAWSSSGRLLLLALAGSLIPYAFTWRLLSDWRFTEHAYPFFLLAACTAFVRLAGVARHPRRALAAMSRQNLTIAAGAVAAVAIITFVLTRISPVLVFAEQLSAGQEATIFAGDRDAAFFDAAVWPSVVRAETVTTRVTSNTRPSVRIPLSAGRNYDAVVRIDPSQTPVTTGEVPDIQILLNGRLLQTCHSESSPVRIGTCRIEIPADAVRTRGNRLTFASDRADGFRVWYVRVRRE